MREASFASKPALAVRFSGHGRAGTVRCYYGITPTASASGFPALKGWARSRRAGVGFPTIKCEVQTDQPGYWNVLGWIQWVTQAFPSKRKPVELVDRPPALLDRDLPFATFGYAPTFFDAPAYLSLPAIDFRAALFLCTLPIMSRREPIAPLAGFTWGYEIAEPKDHPKPHALELAGRGDWLRVRSCLSEHHPKWRFAADFKQPASSTK